MHLHMNLIFKPYIFFYTLSILSLEVITLNYFDGFRNLNLGIALVLAYNTRKNYYYNSNEDPRYARLARIGNYSCKEEIQRYLYDTEEMANEQIVH